MPSLYTSGFYIRWDRRVWTTTGTISKYITIVTIVWKGTTSIILKCMTLCFQRCIIPQQCAQFNLMWLFYRGSITAIATWKWCHQAPPLDNQGRVISICDHVNFFRKFSYYGDTYPWNEGSYTVCVWWH